VRALFEVGSVSRNDLRRAQVRTAQSELDSLTRRQGIVVQRILLAEQLGIAEERLDDVDTSLVISRRSDDLETLVQEAGRARPDLRSAETELAAARANVSSARLDYLPYVSGSASMTFNPSSRSTSTVDPPGAPGIPPGVSSSESESDRETSAQIAVNLDLFNGLATQARNASAKARLMRAQESRDVLQRGLRGEVRRSLLAYEAAVAGEQVARRALESARESLKLAREKYNVGSATILDLIDAQVSHERANADLVSALAAIRVADADLERVRGRAE
jgi:outer membrane protein